MSIGCSNRQTIHGLLCSSINGNKPSKYLAMEGDSLSHYTVFLSCQLSRWLIKQPNHNDHTYSIDYDRDDYEYITDGSIDCDMSMLWLSVTISHQYKGYDHCIQHEYEGYRQSSPQWYQHQLKQQIIKLVYLVTWQHINISFVLWRAGYFTQFKGGWSIKLHKTTVYCFLPLKQIQLLHGILNVLIILDQ